ncbi:MAG TPA: hypothetical protein PKN48_01045 [Bacteroidales bacterium]|nr:hypothetical protein [Bacteroidales bacterium]
MKFNVNDVVRVTRKEESEAGVWEANWVTQMDKCIGKEYKVIRYNRKYGYLLATGIDVEGTYWFPESVLELTITSPMQIYDRFKVVAL